MDRAVPEDYQPRLTPWSHVWRTLLMLTVSGVVFSTVVERQSQGIFLLDVGLGLLAVGVVFFRRRWPLAVNLVLVSLATVSSIAAGPSMLAAVSLATRRRWVPIICVALLNAVSSYVFTLVQPAEDELSFLATMASNVGFISAVMAWGMYIGSRRELLWTLRHRAERAEAEQELRAGSARDAERARIAREMHDVLAHRISQISMHAGALSFREDLSAEELRDGAGVIRDRAHEALTDLRSVLGVLRDRETGEVQHKPQPTYADLPGLIEDVRGEGTRVEFSDAVVVGVPDSVGRTAYRIVQEVLTNARKHAPGATVRVVLTGDEATGLDIEARNPLGFRTSGTPGARLGLLGLRERAELSGGWLEHRIDGSDFVVHGWIPWPS